MNLVASFDLVSQAILEDRACNAEERIQRIAALAVIAKQLGFTDEAAALFLKSEHLLKADEAQLLFNDLIQARRDRA